MLSSVSPLLCWGWVGDAVRVLLCTWYPLGILGVQTSRRNREKLRLQRAAGRAAKSRFSQLSPIRNPTCSDQTVAEDPFHGCCWAEVPPCPGKWHFLCCFLRGWCDDVLFLLLGFTTSYLLAACSQGDAMSAALLGEENILMDLSLWGPAVLVALTCCGQVREDVLGRISCGSQKTNLNSLFS